MIPQDFRETIVKPALVTIHLWTAAAEDLLVGTAIQESGLRDAQQLGEGPALGYFQMEPATHDDIWENYLRYRPIFSDRARFLAGEDAPHASLLLENPKYACAMARFKYLRAPEPLPAFGDVAGYASIWKRVYNTAAGAGTEQEFIDNWKALVASGNTAVA